MLKRVFSSLNGLETDTVCFTPYLNSKNLVRIMIIDLDCHTLLVESALKRHWCVQSDTFVYDLSKGQTSDKNRDLIYHQFHL